MEFHKSLQRNSIYFGIVLTLFEAFIINYSKRGHGLCLCGLGVNVTNTWDMPCLLSSNSHSPPATVSLTLSRLGGPLGVLLESIVHISPNNGSIEMIPSGKLVVDVLAIHCTL